MSVIALALALVFATILSGVHFLRSDKKVRLTSRRKALALNLGAAALVLAYFGFFVFTNSVKAAGESAAANPNAGLGYLAMALSTGLATIGAGYAVGAVGSSALGAISEDPKLLGKTLIYVGLAEGIAIYGLIISIIIMGQL